MIRLTDATILAYTKLRTHKIRTSITIIISSLLFGLLVASVIITQGAFQSVREFSKEGYGSRYIVNAYANSFDADIWQNKTIMTRAKVIFKDIIAAKKAAAKKLGITYDETTEQQPVTSINSKEENDFLNLSAPSSIQAVTEYESTKPKYDLAYLEKQAAIYKPSGIYSNVEYSSNDGSLSLMKNGKESFIIKKPTYSYNQNDLGVESMLASGFAFATTDHQMTDSFLLPTASVKSNDPNSIPVLIPYSYAEKLLNLKKLSNNATPKVKLDRVKEIQDKAGSINYFACYRNSVSRQQIDTAMAQAVEIEKNKANKDYQKPTLIYGLPSTDTCGAATIIYDTRTNEQKIYDSKQKEFDKQFGATVDPDQQKVNFHVIGLAPDTSNLDLSYDPSGLLSTLFSSSGFGGVEVPSDQFIKLPNINRLKEILTPPNGATTSSSTAYSVEFSKANDASNFISEKSCNGGDPSDCAKIDKPFQLVAFGSNSIALNKIERSFMDMFKIAVLVVIAIASIIMSGTLGRMIADSRRETAVFRAIGFKRIDIMSIYITYIFILSAMVALISFVVGVSVAYTVDQYLWANFTVQSLLSFGASDMSRQFHFIKINTPELSWVFGSIIAAGLLSTIIPLIRNVRRNPIKDMRDE